MSSGKCSAEPAGEAAPKETDCQLCGVIKPSLFATASAVERTRCWFPERVCSRHASERAACLWRTVTAARLFCPGPDGSNVMRIGVTGWIATGLACCTVGNALAAPAIDPSLLSDPVATARWTSATILVIGSSARPGAPAVYEEIHAETAMAIGNRAFSPLP